MDLDDIYECPQCNHKISVPANLTTEDQDEIARLFRSGRKVESIVLVRSKLGLRFDESKIIVRHISDPQHRCANCNGKLIETGITYCPTCSGLNLNW